MSHEYYRSLSYGGEKSILTEDAAICTMFEQMCIGYSKVTRGTDRELAITIKDEHVPFFHDLFNDNYEPVNFIEFLNICQRSKEVFGVIMRGSFGKSEEQRFQPCQDELYILKNLPQAMHLCRDLRHRVTLQQFYQALLPGDFGAGRPIDFLRHNRDTIFHVGNDTKEFEDLEKRAEEVADEIVRRNEKYVRTTRSVQLLDGHGRMLVLILRALDQRKIDLEDTNFEVFEIDDTVHEFHEYVFNRQITCSKECIISQYPLPNNEMIYLNFCSIPSTSDFKWTQYFRSNNNNAACVKENVLKFIAKVANRQCSVMISFVLKHNMDDNIYQAKFKDTMGSYLTGLGFLAALLNEFKAEIISIRPKNEVEWEDPRKKKFPTGLKRGGRGCPFITLLIKPGRYQRKLDQLFRDGFDRKYCKKGKKENIADLKENLRAGRYVRIVSPLGRIRYGTIESRTAAQADVILDNGGRARPSITQLEPVQFR